MSPCCGFIIGYAVVRIAKKGSETMLHRGFTESANIWKATKLTENANSQEAVAIH